MNNLFNINRFGNYCLKQIHEWERGLFLHFVSIAGIYTILMIIFRFDSGGAEPYITTGGIQFIIWSSFYIYTAKMSSGLSAQIGTRSRQVLYSMVPASTLEKYLVHLLSVFLLYPFLFFSGILVAQYLSELFSTLVWQRPFQPGMPLEGCFLWSDIGSYLAVTLNLVTIFTLGAMLWKRNTFIKTISAFIVLNIIQVFLWMIFLTGEDIVMFAINMYIHTMETGEDFSWVITLGAYIPAIVFGIIGYMRLKEMEVNETRK